MKVLFAWNGPASTAERDPIARRQVPLLEALALHGVQSRVVLFGDGGGLAAGLTAGGIDVDVVATPLPPSASAIVRLPVAVRAIRTEIHHHMPDVVEGDEPMPAIAAGFAGRSVGRVVVYRRHHAGGRRRLLVASRLAARLADRTIVSNERMRLCAAQQDGTALSRIDVASSGTPEPGEPTASDALDVRQSLGIPPNAPVVLAVSRLRREKGVDVLIAALDRLTDVPGLHCVILGDGPEEAALRDMAGVSRVPVHLPGHQPDVNRWLAVADVVALPSRRESMGRVTLEAMAAGRPVVASRVGGIPTAIAHGESGLLVPPEDPIALARAIRAVLTTPGLGARLGEAARREHAARFTIDHMAVEWQRSWERALSARGRP